MPNTLGVTPGLDPVAAARANQLVTAVRHNGTVMAEVELPRWAGEFLRMGDTLASGRIDAVLTWYCAQLARPKAQRPPDLPTAYSASTFRQRFEKIEASMHLNDDGGSYGPVVGGICRRLRCEPWPGVCAQQLPGAVNMTLNRYKAWLPVRDAAVERLRGVERDLYKFGKYMQQRTPAPPLFTEVWWEDVWRDIHRRTAFTNLMGEVFDWPCKRFHLMGFGWANEYNGSTDLWLRFASEIDA